MLNIPTIDDMGDISGKIVILRLDLNVPIVDGKIVDTFRIDKSINTIDILRLKKAKVIIIAHLENKEEKSLYPVWEYLNGFLPLLFSKNIFGAETIDQISSLEEGGVIMLENLRLDEGEKNNNLDFAEKLASYADIYVNDAFSVSHRAHASIVALPTILPHCAGPLFINEVQNLSKAFSPGHPFLFILGGAKFETKLPLIQKFLKTADSVFVGGALANNILKEVGCKTGLSLVSEGEFEINEMLKGCKLKYPMDVTVKNNKGEVEIKNIDEVLEEDYIADCGDQTIENLTTEIEKAKFILWNGPLGNYEIGFSDKTEKLAEIISRSPATTIVGGGDTLSAIEKLNLLDKFSFVSTGGGAMLDFLANETLPGIEVLK